MTEQPIDLEALRAQFLRDQHAAAAAEVAHQVKSRALPGETVPEHPPEELPAQDPVASRVVAAYVARSLAGRIDRCSHLDGQMGDLAFSWWTSALPTVLWCGGPRCDQKSVFAILTVRRRLPAACLGCARTSQDVRPRLRIAYGNTLLIAHLCSSCLDAPAHDRQGPST